MCSHRAGKFKSSVILCDMKQVCELSEDACARRVMSSTWSVSTSQSLAGLGRSSGQLGGSSAARLCSRRSPLVSPNIAPKHSKAQPPTTQRQHTRPIRKLSPTAPSIHLQARPTLSVFRESREIFFRNFFGRQRTLARWTVVVALAALCLLGRWWSRPSFTY